MSEKMQVDHKLLARKYSYSIRNHSNYFAGPKVNNKRQSRHFFPSYLAIMGYIRDSDTEKTFNKCLFESMVDKQIANINF